MNDSNHRACRQVALAQSGLAQIQRCAECGCVSVHLGATTLRFDDGALHALHAVLGQAVRQLGRSEPAMLLSSSAARGLA